MFYRARRAQSILEYAVLLSALCAVFLTMLIYVKNSVRARLFISQQRINEAAR